MADSMNNPELKKPARFVQAYETVMFWAVVLFCVFHMTGCTYWNIIGDRILFYRIDVRFGELILLGFIGYLCLTRFYYPAAYSRLKGVAARFRAYEYWFLFILPFWYVLSAALRQVTAGVPSVRDNEWWIFITAVCSFILFPLAGFAGAERARKVIHLIVKAVLIPNLLFTVWILWKYFHIESVSFPSGNFLAMMDDYSLIIGENRMHTGYRALAMSAICVYLAFSEKSYRKIPYSIGILVYLSTLILSNNRGSWYAVLLLFAILAFLLPWHTLRENSRLARCLLGLLCVFACVLVLHWFRGEMFRLLDRTIASHNDSLAMSRITAESTGGRFGGNTWQVAPLASAVKQEQASPSATVRSFDAGLSGRGKVYKASLSAMFRDVHHLLFGMTHAEVGTALMEFTGGNTVQSSAHNFFLQMGVAFGVPMMLASVVFAIMLLLRSWRILLAEYELFPGSRMVPLVIIPMFIADMVDTTLTAGATFPCAAFYLFAGWTVALYGTSTPEEKKRDAVRTGIIVGELVLLAATVFWLAPWFHTLRSTVVPGSMKRTDAALCLCILTLLAGVEQVLEALLLRRKPEKWKTIPTLLLSAILVGGLLFANNQINRICRQNSASLEQERPAVAAIQSAANCRLLVDDMPEVYRRTFDGVSRSLYRGEELVQFQNTALVTDADVEYNALIVRGFLYTEIAQNRAVYTNSPEAARVLKEAGYHLTGYYSRNRAVDLSSDGNVNLYRTNYQANYDLRLIMESGRAKPAEDDPAVTITVTMKNGSTIASRDVLFSEFDENGFCRAALDFTPSKAGEAAFLIAPRQSAFPVMLEAIHYRRNPDYDTHAVYNTAGKRTTEFYFDLEGEPFAVSDGSQGKSFAYDEAGNTSDICYLDAEGNLLLNKYGYAERRREFNEDKLLVCEEYLDIDGAPVNIGIGYQRYENEYTAEGKLSLSYYYDAGGDRVTCGSSYFHEYLTELAARKNAAIFIAVKDDGTSALTGTLLNDLKKLGIRSDLAGKKQYSYYSVITPEGVVEELSPDQPVSYSGVVDGLEYTITSAGHNAGNNCLIMIDGTEYSKNVRGMNLVVVEDGQVTDAVAFDTYNQIMKVTK